ncbi:cell division protein ZapE [Candidatus Liberibacter sp.]|uniref:cell division protein ZapE n=1 Tax=Candidatus Liberibacter sp. TaxID=34022 RepID=UPI0015F56DF3|nr:cell division protein ZapE [Candidatus Liberibacter sp.]MBA5724168.1 AFG1 family ATPase [Candidatus Liberibacter sp.]
MSGILRSFRIVRDRLAELIHDGKLRHDPGQERIAASFDRVLDDFYKRKDLRKWRSWLLSFFQRRSHCIKGLYLYGDVGQGKSMLLDLFFTLAPVEKKRKFHFYEFMEEVHRRIAMHRKKLGSGESQEYDPILPVAASIVAEASLLCFDEFMVTDVADAVILSRLFSELFARNCVLVATSNVAPENLYKDGINRDIFVPFIALLNQTVEVISLDSGQDYRRKKSLIFPIYVTPLNALSAEIMDKLWIEITAGNTFCSTDILAKGGYNIHVPAFCGKIARFSFLNLCGRHFSASDFLEIATRFSIVFIDDVPILGEDRRDWMKRFIMLIDVFYECNICLIMSSEADIEDFFSCKSGIEGFEFNRTVSRLFEMCSESYVSNHKIVVDVCNKVFPLKT